MTRPSDPTAAIQPWTLMSSDLLHRDRWLSVRADTCLTADGTKISPYYVLEFPDWVTIVAIDEDDCLLLIEQYRHPVAAVVLGLPGGGIDRQDADFTAAARRELREETGYESDSWTFIAKMASNPAHMNSYCHVLLARCARRTCEPAHDPTEQVRVVLTPVSQIRQKALQGEVINAAEVAALALALTAIDRW